MARTYPIGGGVVKWVSTDWLEQHLHDTDLMILDVQPDVHDYIKRHIPGAVYFNEGLLRCPLTGTPAYYVPTTSIQAVFRRVGLRADVPVVVYTGSGGMKGWGDGLEQTMLAYSLARFGHDNVCILDGGIDKWQKEDRHLTKEFPTVADSDFEAKVRSEYFLEYEEFTQIKDRDDVMLLDVRPANVYEGQGPWSKPGHIPGAHNLPWQSLMDEKNKRLLKPHEEIQSIICDHNVSPERTVICSCGTGREATNAFALFKWYLDYPNVKLYEGSFTEWVAWDNPTVTGKSPYEPAMAAEERA